MASLEQARSLRFAISGAFGNSPFLEKVSGKYLIVISYHRILAPSSEERDSSA